jgi:N-methylhydantoinase A
MLAGFPLRMSSLDVNAVGAGGGSIAWLDIDGLLKVGPQSAGATPGPACYGLGGDQVTVTDANVVLGRLNGEALLDGTMPIDKSLSEQAISKLADSLSMPADETAQGILAVTTAVMVKAVRAISVERGYNPSEFALFAFGGAGPLHACDVARELDIATVIIPPNPGILCAEGLLQCDLRSDFVTTVFRPLHTDESAGFKVAGDAVAQRAETWFEREALADDRRNLNWSADLRYIGQNFELTLPLQNNQLAAADIEALSARFHDAHDVAYGFASPGEPIELVSLRAVATGTLDKPPVVRIAQAETPGQAPPSSDSREVLFDASTMATPVYRRADLRSGHAITGPAIVEQLDTTVIIHPGDKAQVDAIGNIVIALGDIGA